MGPVVATGIIGAPDDTGSVWAFSGRGLVLLERALDGGQRCQKQGRVCFEIGWE